MTSKKQHLADLLKKLKHLHEAEAITSDEFRTLRSEAYKEFELQPDDLGSEDISIPSEWLQKLIGWLVLFSVGIAVYMTVLRPTDNENSKQPISDPPASTSTSTSTSTSLPISTPSQSPLSNSFIPPLALITGDLPQGLITDLPSSTIRFIQEILNNNGYYLGSADGLWGTRSEAALFDFQIDLSIDQSNVLDRIFWIQVFSKLRSKSSVLSDEPKIGLNDTVLPASAVLFQTASNTDGQITSERYVLPFYASLDDVALWFLARDLVGADVESWVMPEWDTPNVAEEQNVPEESVTFTLLASDATTTVTILNAGVGRVDLVIKFE